MKKQGLQISATDIYNPNDVSLKDVVGIFGGGCTGEIISANGLLITNHHCGYSSIQQHSTLDHNYLRDGFWSMSQKEELPTEGLSFTMVERIMDVTDSIQALVKSGKATQEDIFSNTFLNGYAGKMLTQLGLKGKPGISGNLLPYYAGNKYYMIVYKTYNDIRMVAAPPSSIGKFGDETDNWMWPRHTGDFSVFRIYADENGEPASYSEKNVPLKCKKYLSVSLRGVEEGDFAMILGFPGSTSRFLTRSEVQQRMECENAPRIKVRDAILKVLREEMAKDEAIDIQYASTFAQCSNYWKNSIGMNKALVDNKVLDRKSAEEEQFNLFAAKQGNEEYRGVTDSIENIVKEMNSLDYMRTSFNETFGMLNFPLSQPYGIQVPDKKDKAKMEEFKKAMREAYKSAHNSEYDMRIDKRLAKTLLPLYAQMNDQRPANFDLIEKKYKGSYDKYVDDLYDNSIMSNEKNLEKFLKNPSQKAMDKDLAMGAYSSVIEFAQKLRMDAAPYRTKLQLLHRTYVRGLCAMYAPTPKSPDANFTLRLTYGNVKSYEPRNGVSYSYYTTLDGVMEKEDTVKGSEFEVPARLKELYKARDYGRYALPSGKMPVCFLTTNDITGGNSGSPVINGKGELLGLAFDGNWESLSGDISFEDAKQRCIAVDIRYVLFIIEKYGNCKRLIDEMTIAE